jgi:hypothetical protein
MTYVQDVTAKNQIPIEHYVKILKQHEESRASFNERMEYWKKYHKENTNVVNK